MARINLPLEVLKHEQDEVIEFLAAQAKDVRATFRNAVNSGKTEMLLTTLVDVELLTEILIELDRRNKEHTLK